jgi:Zn-dependent oligopeptidase
VEYLAAALLDLDLHTRRDGDVDLGSYENEALARIGVPREIALRHRLPHFDHLFGSDAYSAGCYRYLWSDVIAADTWQGFLEAGGPWDKAVADRMRGGTSCRTATPSIVPRRTVRSEDANRASRPCSRSAGRRQPDGR